MRKIALPILGILTLFLATSSVTVQSSTGIAGYTGSPGEGRCSQCHGGGFSAASGITISAVPSFSNNQYMPDSTYKLLVRAAAAGYSRFGFACEALGSGNLNAGILGADLSAGVKTIVAANGRRNAVHMVPKAGDTATFVFPWKAPSSGTVTIYAIANAVNGNGNTQGDFPLQTTSLRLEPLVLPQDTTPQDTTALPEEALTIVSAHIYPQPARGAVTLALSPPLPGPWQVLLLDLAGRQVTLPVTLDLPPGSTRLSLDLKEVPAGIYLLKVRGPRGVKTEQRLVLQ